MSLVAEYAAGQTPEFVQRCQVAAVFFAVNSISVEAATVDNYERRQHFAQRVVECPAYWAPLLAQGVIALNQSSDGAALTDAVVNNSIAAIWNVYAGRV